MNEIEEMTNVLKFLSTAEITTCTEFLKIVPLLDEVLEAIFKIEISGTKFSITDKNIIGPLFNDLLDLFAIWVSYTVGRIREQHSEDYKIRRSGLEFLLERYKEFPNGKDKSLESALNNFRITEDIEGLDEMFNSKKYVYDTQMFYGSSDEPTLNAQDIEHVPLSHWWWRS
ncbi:hypothetical protein AVEN_26395-1 [Araneus ventricosus]|uniref:Uncharacterized protein n=1 Tax=Araneus ventricosus TaxID=182803 RepID=A0A4Y2Q0L1_ARAVE|nr:hypothetical protein AVEN_26395-1 [Araneus ventricosus]